MDNNGVPVFMRQIRVSQFPTGAYIVKLNNKNEIICLSLFRPSANWGTDILLQKYNSGGDIIWTRSIGGKDYYYWIHGMIITSDGGIAFTGSGPDCEIGLCAWLVKTDSLGNGTYPVGYEFNNINEESNPINEISIYPNPANIELNIVLPYENINGKIEIFNITGQLMLRNDNCKNNCSFSVANLPEGIYLVKTQINSRVYINKIIIHH